jgi:hypothetical protein
MSDSHLIPVIAGLWRPSRSSMRDLPRFDMNFDLCIEQMKWELKNGIDRRFHFWESGGRCESLKISGDLPTVKGNSGNIYLFICFWMRHQSMATNDWEQIMAERISIHKQMKSKSSEMNQGINN